VPWRHSTTTLTPILGLNPTVKEEENAWNRDQNDKNLRKLIRGVVEQEEWVEIQNLTTLRAVYQALLARHSKGLAITLWSLWDKLMALNIDGTSADQIHKVVTDLRLLLNRIWNIGAPMKSDMRAMVLLRTVNDVKGVQSQLVDNISNGRLTKDNVVCQLETKADLLTRISQAADQFAAIVITADTVCTRCAGYGHIARFCGSPAATSEAPHVKVLLVKRKDSLKPMPKPFKAFHCNSKKYKDGAKDSARNGARNVTPKHWCCGQQAHVADGSSTPRTITVNGVTYSENATVTAATANDTSNSDLDSKAASQVGQWAGAADVNIEAMSKSALDKLLAANSEATVSTAILSKCVQSQTLDDVLALMLTIVPPPAIPVHNMASKTTASEPYNITINRHTIAHVGEER
jgi:hypothetical protein